MSQTVLPNEPFLPGGYTAARQVTASRSPPRPSCHSLALVLSLFRACVMRPRLGLINAFNAPRHVTFIEIQPVNEEGRERQGEGENERGT